VDAPGGDGDDEGEIDIPGRPLCSGFGARWPVNSGPVRAFVDQHGALSRHTPVIVM
jgi:hypothetical protein